MADFELVFDENGVFKKAKKNGKDAVEKSEELKQYSQKDLDKHPKVEFTFIHGNSVRCIVHGGRLY
jgi:hypothetical protein